MENDWIVETYYDVYNDIAAPVLLAVGGKPQD